MARGSARVLLDRDDAVQVVPGADRDLEVDVLVVGGGIVGVTTALLVAKGGRRVALVESKGAHDAKRLIGDRLVGDEPAETVVELEPGEGEIVRVEGERLAVSRDSAGALRAVSAACTHLGCIVSWNDAEESWDCPCHGSRFAATGEVLHGPATAPLVDRSELLAAVPAPGA